MPIDTLEVLIMNGAKNMQGDEGASPGDTPSVEDSAAKGKDDAEKQRLKLEKEAEKLQKKLEKERARAEKEAEKERLHAEKEAEKEKARAEKEVGCLILHFGGCGS